MEMGLQAKVAAVAGASRGLGRAVAEGLAAEGCHLAICSRDQKAISAAAQEIAAAHGVEVFPQAVDLAQAGAAHGFVESACAHFGRLEILVTNNGGPPAGAFADFSEEDWLAAVRLTLLPAQAMARAAIPAMRRAGWGRIVNLTSISVRQPLPGLMLSNSIRAAVVGWAKSLADELAPHGITVNNVMPGWIHTERVEELLRYRARTQNTTPEEARAAIEQTIPLRRLGRPEELAHLVVFLASERASYITGASYWIDGGLYRGLM